jgi:outer membrane receptor for ferrienterochelin and colicin
MRFRGLTVLMSGWCLVATATGAEEPPDLSGLSVEELAQLDMVFAASRRSQSQREAPAFVTVVTANEIRRYGHRTLADVLRQVPGFYITDDHNYSYVGVRGFSRPGDYSTRVLLLVDGLRVNDNIYDEALVGREFQLDAALIERVEVVRGPGAAVYGNNAFFAVINVITRRGQNIEGGEFALEGGSHTSGGTRMTYGRRFASGLDVTASVSGWRTSGPDLYFPELDHPETGGGRAIGVNGERSESAFFAVSFRGFTLRGHGVDRRKTVPTAAYETVFGDPRNWTNDRNVLLAAEYEGASRGWTYAARASHGRSDYRGSYVYPGDDLYADGSHGLWWGVDAHASSPEFGRHRFTFGGEVQDDVHQDQWWESSLTGERTVDSRRRSWRGGAFVEDEVRLSPSLRANVGLRYDGHPTADRLSPRAALIWMPASATTVKVLYGSAFRAANEYERHYYEAQTAEPRPESIRTFEIVGERALTGRLRLTASVFENRIRDLISLVSDEDGHRLFTNTDSLRSRGLDLAMEARQGKDLRLRAAYGYQLTRDEGTRQDISNSPRHLVKLDTALPLGSRFSGGLSLQHISPRRSLRGGRTPSATLVDVSVTAPAIWRRLDLSVGLRNLFDSRWADPGSEEHLQTFIPQDGRTVNVRAVWSF